MKQLDLLLVNPNARRLVYQSLADQACAIEPPIWCGLLATFILRHGFNVQVLDANADGLSAVETAEQIKEGKPRLTAVVCYGQHPSASTQVMPAAINLVMALKSIAPDCKVMVVGGHVAALPERSLQETGADYACTGEGCYTILDVLKGRPLEDCRGLTYLQKFGRVGNTEDYLGLALETTHPAPNVQNLDADMPAVAWDLLPSLDKYRCHNWQSWAAPELGRSPYAAIYTTLGCKWACTFCLAHGTTIVTAKGHNKKIQKVKVGDVLLGWDEAAGQFAETTVVATGSRSVADLLKIETENGTLLITEEHPVYTTRGWVEAGELTIEDQIWAMESRDKQSFMIKQRWAEGSMTHTEEHKARIGKGVRKAFAEGRKVYTDEQKAAASARMRLLRTNGTIPNHIPSDEEKAAASARMRVDNPMKRPEVAAKVSEAMKAQSEELSNRMRQRWADGTITGHTVSEEEKQAASERMKQRNPMHLPEVAAKVGATMRKKIAAGEYVPWMSTDEGRTVIAEIARERALTDNPMKDPAVARDPALLELRSRMTKERWADEEQADALMKAREGKYLTGPDHPLWQGGKSKEEYSSKFTSYYKRKVKRRDGYTCQECGCQDVMKLTIHHIDYDKNNDDPCNWITLCGSCHGKVSGVSHGGNGKKSREEWREYFQAKMTERGHCPHFTPITRISRVTPEIVKKRRRHGFKGGFAVYNFQCAPHDNYFAENLLVHNCCIQSPFAEGDRLEAVAKATKHNLSGVTTGGPKLTMVEQIRNAPNSYRYWNPDSIGRQIAQLYYDQGVRNFKLADEMFVLNRKHVLGVCEAIGKCIRNPHDRLNIWAYARVDTCNDTELLIALRSAGFRWLAIGVESASESIRDEVAKGFRQDKIVQCFDRVKSAGLYVGANYIFGLPGDTLETIQETYNLACNLNTPYANFYCFPAGTQVWTPGGFKGIETLVLGDQVYGKSGITKVTQTGNRLANDLVEVKPRYLPSFRCTSEHPIYVAVISREKRTNRATFRRFEWVDAGQMKPFNKEDKYAEYHALCINRNSFRREQTYLDLSPYVIGHLGAGQKGGQLNEIGQKYMKPWPVTEELAELFGWYTAEGSIACRINKQIGFALHRNETEHHARIQYLISRCLGLKSRVLVHDKNCVMIQFTSKVWLRAVHSIFGKDARTKRIPECIMDASDAVGRAFLKGYCDGDGTSWPNSLGQHGVNTASMGLGQQLTMLFLKLGVVPSCTITKPVVKAIAGRGMCKTGAQYRIAWMDRVEERKVHRRFLKTDDWFFIPVKSVECLYAEERVYNISTEDETYSMPWVTHNCSMPYPGSKMWHDYPAHHELPWTAFAQFGYDCHPTATDTLTSADVLAFREKAFHEYFSRPTYLAMMGKEFSAEVVESIKRMESNHLKFKLLEEQHAAVPKSDRRASVDVGVIGDIVDRHMGDVETTGIS